MEELLTPSNVIKAVVYVCGLVGMVYANKLHINILAKKQDKMCVDIEEVKTNTIKNCTDIRHIKTDFEKLEERCYNRHAS